LSKQPQHPPNSRIGEDETAANGEGVNRFNLTFWGEILPGHDPQKARARFGKLFQIGDAERLERFFSGQTITLRRNLDRKTAADYYRKLHQIGLEARLVKAEPPALAEPGIAVPEPPPREQRQPAAEAARRWAGKIAQKREAANQAALRKAEARELERAVAEEAARVRAERRAQQEEERRAADARAAEETARRRALEQERLRREAEDAARRAEAAALRRAEEQERKRRAEEEAARQAAERRREQAEQRRLEAEKKAQLAAEQRRARAEAADRVAREKAEQRRLAEQEKARLQAERKAAAARAAEEAARKKADARQRRREAALKVAGEKAERKRLAAEKRARLAAERQRTRAEADRAKAERKHLAEEENARLRAEREAARAREAQEAARRRAEDSERRRRQAEQAARQKAEEEQRQRREAEAVARRKAGQAEQQRRAREESARLKAQRRTAARQAARERVEQRRIAAEAAAREKAEEAARQKRDKLRLEAEAEARRQAAKALEREQREAMDTQAITRAARELARQPATKSPGGTVRNALTLPGQLPADEPASPRQAGEPNLYSLEPFRNTAEVQGRADRSQKLARHFRYAAILAGAVLMLLCGRYLGLAPDPPLSGPRGLAVAPTGGPVLLAGDHLLVHDRSGTGIADRAAGTLGAAELQPPLAFDHEGNLLAVGRLVGSESGIPELLRCSLAEIACRPVGADLAGAAIDALAVHPLSGELYVADAASGRLLKFAADGRLLAGEDAAIPERPVIRLESGLLFMKSAEGPAISVFRYEKDAFGRQLDEILLLPSGAEAADQSRVGDFVWSGDHWWVTLYHPDTGEAGLYRFDAQWNPAGQAELPEGANPAWLAAWGDKTLVGDPERAEIQRFNAAGAREAPLASTLLENLVAGGRRDACISRLLWRAALLLCALGAAGSACLALFHHLRALVYRGNHERGAPAIDLLAGTIDWISTAGNRSTRLRLALLACLAGTAFALSLASIGGLAPVPLAAFALALAGPCGAVLLILRRPPGHIGLVDGQLLLVDHRGTYHLGRDARVRYRGPFLSIDDVVIFTGTTLLPAFSPEQFRERVAPLRSAGIGMDCATVAVKLLQSRHALAGGVLLTLIAAAGALALLFLGWP